MFNWLTKRKGTAPQAAVPPTPAEAPPLAPSETKRREGNALLESNQLDAAATCYREAIRLDDRSVASRINLAYVLTEQQRKPEAEGLLLQAAAIDPNNLDAAYMLGNAARARGDLVAAAQHFDRAIEIQPDFELAYRDACLAYVEAGKSDKVETLLRRGLQALPQSADLHFLLGNALQVAERSEEAIDSYKRAVAIRPGHIEAHSNMAVVLRSLGRLEDAIAPMQIVAALQPSVLNAHMEYGTALQSLGRLDSAVAAFRRAIAVEPTSAVGLSALGSAFAAQGRSDEAIAQYRLALTADKTHSFAYAGLGVELNEQGRPGEAVESMREAVALDPEAIEAHSSMMFLMSFVADPAEYLKEARRYGEKAAARAKPASLPMVKLPVGPARLRVGLVSGDLRAHPVAVFLEGVLAALDRNRIEVFAYVTSKHEDDVTARLRAHCTGWQSIVGMTDEAAARRIRADCIDVLIDLAGHTAHNRLSMFAWRPAPVQATWLGYLASTGLSSIDYVMADRISLPEVNQHHFIEKAWYLPNSLYCFTAPLSSPKVCQLPALAARGVTFGSFQRMNKVSDETLQTWGQILRRLPTARLRLQSKQMADERARARLHERLRAAGVPIDRVDLAGPIQDRSAYLACHDEVDIVLDTFPYPGITTTCEALWMGVPTVTLAGDTLLSRQGASLLGCVGLQDWIAGDAADYVERAVRHASDLQALAQLRSELRARASASPLFDAARFARDLDLALHEMRQRSTTGRLSDPA